MSNNQSRERKHVICMKHELGFPFFEPDRYDSDDEAYEAAYDLAEEAADREYRRDGDCAIIPYAPRTDYWGRNPEMDFARTLWELVMKGQPDKAIDANPDASGRIPWVELIDRIHGEFYIIREETDEDVEYRLKQS